MSTFTVKLINQQLTDKADIPCLEGKIFWIGPQEQRDGFHQGETEMTQRFGIADLDSTQGDQTGSIFVTAINKDPIPESMKFHKVRLTHGAGKGLKLDEWKNGKKNLKLTSTGHIIDLGEIPQGQPAPHPQGQPTPPQQPAQAPPQQTYHPDPELAHPDPELAHPDPELAHPDPELAQAKPASRMHENHAKVEKRVEELASVWACCFKTAVRTQKCILEHTGHAHGAAGLATTLFIQATRELGLSQTDALKLPKCKITDDQWKYHMAMQEAEYRLISGQITGDELLRVSEAVRVSREARPQPQQ